ncbi:DUF3606 domain-containing protein [Brevundimonas albigilva]|uniref:DUF3606 domain-containing protein n=1 Tax=Brevundimonas albigilva TaxID=1312364 RepID=A0ABY4SKT6_9CAUL|nr:DUF3606 domain-containing protein [Brevundimonas albigilva]UQV19641.1 DUF3606 domain-containing protein [Brevundimonas albigilva]URI15332.1 DUF3606 domain-containing protein [Brevundimonas albigilva]
MSDDKSQTGNPDRQRVSLSEDYEVQDWSKRFGVTADQLRAAVDAVGNQAEDIEKYLSRKSGPA